MNNRLTCAVLLQMVAIILIGFASLQDTVPRIVLNISIIILVLVKVLLVPLAIGRNLDGSNGSSPPGGSPPRGGGSE